jgi:ABC-type phosphate transport system auxiliary subunit
MSIITDALKLAASLEKTISKQENEIAKLKAQVESLTTAKAGVDEEARLAALALKMEKKRSNFDLLAIHRNHKATLASVQTELKQVRRELKEALKTPKIPKTKPLVPTNDALGQVKRKPGRPKKVVEPEVPLVDPRQIPIPDLGAPAISADPAQTTSAKGVNYEFV